MGKEKMENQSGFDHIKGGFHMRYKCTKLVAILLIMTLGVLCAACQEKDDSTIHIAWVFGSSENLEAYQQEAESCTTRINEYLQAQQKLYQIQVTAVSQQTVEEDPDWLEAYQLIYGSSMELEFLTNSMEDAFLDLSQELESGKLQALHSSMPETYWEAVSQNGAIYSIVRTELPMMDGLWVFEPGFGKLGLTVPEELIGQPLEAWSDFFEEVYQKNGEQPFLVPPFWIKREGAVIASGYAWEAHFHMVTEHTGISYEQPELGVQCIYESKYANQMNQIWKDYMEKGYVFTQLMDFTDAQVMKNAIIRTNCCYSAKPMSISGGWTTYPLQESAYSSNLDPLYQDWKLFVSKEAKNLDTAYQFLNDLGSDIELAANICTGTVENSYLFWMPMVEVMNPIGGDSTLITGITQPIDENSSNLYTYYEQMQSSPAAGFIFDTENVDAALEQMWSLTHTRNANGEVVNVDPISNQVGETDDWADYEKAMDDCVDQLYQMGMKEVLQEANKQLEAYLGSQ